MTSGSDSRLAVVLAALATEMQAQTGAEATLHTIVEAAAAIVPGARWAGISLVQGKEVIPQAPTHPVVEKLDTLQTELGAGPCLCALREHHGVHIQDIATDTRWPEFARTAISLGVHTSLSFQLFVRASTLGALNLYGSEPGVFGEDAVIVGGALAQHAAVAMAGESVQTQLQKALASRDVIGQAKGLLMHRDDLTDAQASELLVRASQDTQVMLVEVARWLIDEHLAYLRGAKSLPASEYPKT